MFDDLKYMMLAYVVAIVFLAIYEYRHRKQNERDNNANK